MKFWNMKKTSNNDGILELDGPISQNTWWGDEVTPKQFKDDLKGLGDIKNLLVKINSGGGDVFAATTIYSALKEHPAKVTAKIDGLAASAATIICMAADEIQIPSAAIMMIHNPSVFLFGGYESSGLLKLSETLGTIKDSIIEAYLSKVNVPKDELQKMMDEETWMTGREAVENGFADTLLYDKVNASITNNMLVLNSVSHDITKLKIPSRIVNDIKTSTLEDGNKHGEETEKVEIKNVEDLKVHYPALVNEIVNEAVNSERLRIKSIDGISNGIPNEMINKAKYDEPISAQELSMQVLISNQNAGNSFFNALKQDAQNSGGESVKTVNGDNSDDSNKEDTIVAGMVNAFKKIVK